MKIEKQYGRPPIPKRPGARMYKAWGVTGSLITELQTYWIADRVHYREPRSGSPRLKVLDDRTFDAVYTTRLEAQQHVDPGKRKRLWLVDYDGEITEVSKAPSGIIYHPKGYRVGPHRTTYKTRRAALQEVAKGLRSKVERAAVDLRALRRELAKARKELGK